MGGKSSSVTVGYRYHVAYFHGICAHPIDKFLEYRAANKTAWSGTLTASGTIHINKPGLFGGDKDQGGIDGDVDIQFGQAGQQPNAYLLSTFGSQTPNWQGFTTLVFKGGEFGAMNPYPQKPAYKILATKAGWDDDTCWYPEKCEVPIASSSTLPPDSTGWEYQTIPYHDSPGTSQLNVPTSGWLEEGQAPFGGGELASQANTNWPIGTILWCRRSVTISGSNAQTLTVSAENGCVVLINGAIAGAINRSNESIPYNNANVFTFPVSAGQTYEIAIKAFDENPPEPTGGTLVTIKIDAPGVTGINPAHVLYEARTAQDRGQEPTANMADANWKAGADWFFNQSFGLCQCEYNADNESVDDFIARISQLAGCSVSRDPVDGLWYLDIANGVYNLESLPILTDNDILEFDDSPTLPDDTINSVAVEYYDPQQWTTVTTRPVTSLALISANGLNHVTNKYREVPTGDLGNRLAERDLMNAMTPSHAFGITTTRKPYAWRRNTYFRLQSPKNGIADIVCLLAEKSDGTLKSGAMKISAAMDIYSLAAASYMGTEPGVDTRPPQIPLGIMQQAVFEAPYFELVRSLKRADLAVLPDDTGFLMAVARDPTQSRDYSIMVSGDGGSPYTDEGNGPWCPNALVVEGDPLDAGLITAFTLADGKLLDQVALGSAALWEGNNGGEIVRVDAIDVEAAPNTITLGRGCTDTVPQTHAADARIWFFDGFAGKDATEYTDGESIDVELLTNTGSDQLDPSLATPMALTFDQRQYRPYPPANVKINGDAYPQAYVGAPTITWSHRDRITQADQLIDTSQGDVGPEAGVTYKVRIFDPDGNSIVEVSDLAVATYTFIDSGSGDPYWSNVIALLHFDGADGSTAIVDEKGNAWTVYGAAALTTAVQKFGASSLGNLAGSIDGIRIPTHPVPPSGTKWCNDCWIYPTGTSASYAAVMGTDGNHGIFLKGGKLNLYWNGDLITGAAAVTLNTEHHVEACWDGTKFGLWLDGISVGTYASTGCLQSTGLYVGCITTAGQGFIGAIDDARFTSGAVRHTPGSNFSVPTAAAPNAAPTAGDLVRLELSAERDDVESFQSNNIWLRRAGYGRSYGYAYGGVP